jgi:hypothetical protein
MRREVVAVAILVGLGWQTRARAQDAAATEDAAVAEADAAPDGGDDGPPAPALRPNALPPELFKPTPPPPPPPIVMPPVRNARDEWPLAYVDRPQLMFEGMEWFSLSGHHLSGRPATLFDMAYSRELVSLGYANALTDRSTLSISLPRLFCTGEGRGGCARNVNIEPSVGLAVGIVDERFVRLKAGASFLFPFERAGVSTRLQLVLPHWATLELEPSVSAGLSSRQTTAWWDPTVTQDGNQPRASLTIDANVQVADNVLLWADAVPYRPVGSSVVDASSPALELGAGASVTFTKSLELHASYWRLNVLDARRWEYVPGVREVIVSLGWRVFDHGPEPRRFRPGPPPTRTTFY